MPFIKVQEIFFDQDMALNPSNAATAQLVLAAQLVVLAGTGTCPSPILSHTATEERTL